MSIVTRFASTDFTAAQYEETVKRLEAAGQGAPAGRLFHVCFGDPSNLRVSDIWESRELFARFGETLMPILKDLGIDPGEMEILEVHNIIEGKKTATATP